MRTQFSLTWRCLPAALSCAMLGSPARADFMASLLPGDVPGYDTQDGVSVRSRLHPELDPLGLRAGAFQFWPRLEEGFGYTTNALSGSNRRPSWAIMTSPSLQIASDGSTDAFGASLSLQDTRYPTVPSQSRTDFTVALGERRAIGADTFSIAAAHLSQHEDRAQAGTLVTDRPVGFNADDISLSYTIVQSRWLIEPGLRLTSWHYDSTTILGLPASQAYRDHLTVQADATIRYEWTPLHNVVFVLRGVGQDYTHSQPNLLNPDSIGAQALAGLEDVSGGLWRWRLLVGTDTTGFANPHYASQTNLIAEAGLTWLPSGLTTVQATLSREDAAAAQQNVSGLMLTTARLVIDHEYLRNLLLQASIGLQQADYFQGGHQHGFVAGLGMTWVINRSVRLSATYEQVDLHGSANPSPDTAGDYSRGVGLLTLRLGL